MLPSSLHLFMSQTFFFSLVRSQHGHSIVPALDGRDQASAFRFFQLIDFCLNRSEIGLLIFQQRMQLKLCDLAVGFQPGLGSFEIQMQGFELADLLRRQPDRFGMFQEMRQIVPAVVILFILIVATMHHLPLAFVGKDWEYVVIATINPTPPTPTIHRLFHFVMIQIPPRFDP